MNVGIIGCGAVAPKHAEAYREIREYNRFFFCDIIQDRAARLADRFSDISSKITVCRDYKKMVKNQRLDLVSICTPPSTHMEIVRDCAREGVNMICEKPIDITLDRAQRIIGSYQHEDVKLAIIFQNRWHPEIQSLKDAMYSEIQPYKVSMSVNWYRPDNYFEDWKGVMSLGGDIVMNQIIHHFDVLRYVFGKVETVFAYAENTRPEVISCMDVCTAVLKFESGLIATLDGTTNCYPMNERTELVVTSNRGTFSVTPKGTVHMHQIKQVMDCLENGEKPEVTPEDATETLKLVLAVHQSAWSGKEVHL